MSQKPARVLITGAAGQIAYSLIFLVARGELLGDRKIILHLLDVPFCKEGLRGVELEVQDGAFPLVEGLVATTDVKEAFTDVDYALLVGAFPRKDGMERKDLLKANAAIFKEQGAALNNYSSRNVKVVVVGNPANTNAHIAQVSAPNIPKENFSALTRLDHNRAKSQIALRLNTNVSNVHNVIIWGNHSSTQYPDITQAFVNISDGKKSVSEAVNDDSYLQNQFITTVQQRGAEVIKARKLSSAASAAKAIVDHMHDWIFGTPEGEFVSMGVYSDGSYGIKEGLIYSFPVTTKNGEYKIVQNLSISDFSRKKMDATATELDEEKAAAAEFLQ